MNTLDAMRGQLRLAVDADPERDRASAAAHTVAARLSPGLSLVHRTVVPGAATLEEVLSTGVLEARRPCTQREHDCGIPRAAYFFLGCSAYPDGAVAFLAGNHVLSTEQASFTPFDTGSLSDYARPRDPARPWADSDKQAFLSQHLARGEDAVAFSVDFLCAHFHDPTDYVSRGQNSEPDYPVYHDLQSNTGDRRAWSIEVQLHADLPLTAETLDAIMLGSHDMMVDIPDDLLGLVAVTDNPGDVASKVKATLLRELRA